MTKSPTLIKYHRRKRDEARQIISFALIGFISAVAFISLFIALERWRPVRMDRRPPHSTMAGRILTYYNKLKDL